MQQPSKITSEFSALLRRERQRAQLSVRQLAAAAGITSSTVSRLESGVIGSPKPEQLQRLARVLGIDVEDFYAAAGFYVPTGLPELQPYLRAKYGLADDATQQIAGYVQALRDQTKDLTKEGRHDNSGDQAA
jgi:transcriptional regulator with XRE-family HTH domain